MNLSEILTKKRQDLGLPSSISARKQESKKEEKEETEDLSFFSNAYNYDPPNRELFIASYAPYLRNPYNYDWKTQREYEKWLCQNKHYILNTFQKIDCSFLIQIYMEIIPIETARELWSLSWFLSNVDLMVPASYQEDFELLARQARRTEKIP